MGPPGTPHLHICIDARGVVDSKFFPRRVVVSDIIHCRCGIIGIPLECEHFIVVKSVKPDLVRGSTTPSQNDTRSTGKAVCFEELECHNMVAEQASSHH